MMKRDMHIQEVKFKIHPKTRIGHTHLYVSSLDKALTFYKEILGFDIISKMPGAVFLSAGENHHHIGLNIWLGKNVS